MGNVQLVGMSREQLQREIKVRKGAKSVFYLPEDIILNSQKAFSIGYATGTNQPFYTLGAPTGRHVAPANAGNCFSGFTGQCGITRLILHGPQFFRADLSAVKKFLISESMN